ncbi:hypothetical protein GCM10010266_73830 [Streptomyces griseomycini]|uniref:Transposase n=1 Tax=Streptomyces griseomycini TaxID=66895 RepID=A0A7W7PYK5_9ACTN|nr:transposase [Streptomyces griseomycini]GGQ39976.1 hypothetical protein GCM10010266_73830 [Streptomyces griseomycini]GGR62095.1 hypothetical protein GCM10015536_77360 [Streptomyces griseomycini]
MGKSQSKVDLYAAIRRDHRGGMSQRALQRKDNVTWRTVRRALDGQWPEPRKQQRRRESRLDPYKPLIDGILRGDLDAPAKQRHTAQRIFDRLVEEHDAYEISYPMVRTYMKDRRPQIRRDAGIGPQAMFVPQTRLPGAEAEIDFGEVHVLLAGEPTRLYLFSLRLSYSGKAVHRVFCTAGQEAFPEGHVHAFRILGGVPRAHIRHDNLRAAVERVPGFYRGRMETDRWTAFRSHWDIEPFSCRPGIEGAHEKGGVEGQIGYFRRDHFVPVPEVASLTELNAMGTEAAMRGFRVRYVLATKLVNELVEAADEKQLSKTIARYGRVDLLCVDELGYVELDRRGAELLFQVLTEREEKNSVAIASNESFSGWTKTFTGPPSLRGHRRPPHPQRLALERQR